MTAALIEIETEDFAGAARALIETAAGPVGEELSRLWSVLADCSGIGCTESQCSSLLPSFKRKMSTMALPRVPGSRMA